MKYSVLLPTRNGGDYLENCILSILEQDFDDFELVISDNANADATPGIIEKYHAHPKVKAVRSERVLSVTENWNNALLSSSGEYILMMGDDDYLLPNYFQRMNGILARHQNPDCVVHNAYSYVAPASIDGNPASYYSEAHFSFAAPLDQEQAMQHALNVSIVRDMFRFRVRIPLNMQTTLIRREAANQIPGGVFQAPFPDHFALNSLLLMSDRWVFSPERLLIVGVSPKSFGHYVYSNEQGGGLAYLGIKSDFPGRLPGSELTNGMYAWLLKLKDVYADQLQGINIDRAGYVRRQIYAWLMQWRLGHLSLMDMIARLRLLSPGDWLGLAATAFDGESWRRLGGIINSKSRGSVESQLHRLQRLDGIATIRQFAQWLVRK